MSKLVKNLMTDELSNRLHGVDDCLVANLIGLDANSTVALRKRLREKDIHILVIKNSLIRRATADSPLAAAFDGLNGCAAVVWGAEDFISLTKEIVEIDKSDDFEAFEARGGVMDGEQLSAEKVHEISKWPNRAEQLSILSGQLTSPYTQLQAQMTAPAGLLASQIEKKAKEGDS